MRWFLAVGRKFLRVAPATTMVVVFSTIASQVSTILTFFLPLKIIILMGSTRVPRYFPQSWADYDRDHLVVFLCLAMVFFFILHHLAEIAIKTCADRGASALLKKTDKLVLFANQQEKAVKAYQLYSESVAAMVFVLLSLSLLGFVYPLLFSGIMGFLAMVATLSFLGVSRSAWLQKLWEESYAEICKTLSTAGFFLAFGIIVAHFLLGAPPGFFIVIISMLFTRQSLGKISTFTINLKKLHRDQLSINSLFFHHHAFIQNPGRQKLCFWDLLEYDQRERWMKDILLRYGNLQANSLKIAWVQTGIRNLAALAVTQRDDNGQIIAKRLVKVFGPKHEEQALNESSLLSSVGENFPAPAFLGAEYVRECICHLFDWSNVSEDPAEKPKIRSDTARISVMQTHVPARLIKKYGRSKQFIWQRVNLDLPQRLELAANTESERELIQEFAHHLPGIQALLQSMPVQFVNPDIRLHALALDARQSPLLWHWGRWTLEPLGASWPVSKPMLKKLDNALGAVHSARSECRNSNNDHVKTSALLFAVEKLFNKQDFKTAIARLPDLLRHYFLAQAASTEKNKNSGMCQ